MPTPATVTGLSVTSRAAAAVGLGWNAAVNAVAYEIFRAPITNGVQGSFRKINASTVAGVIYTDNAANSTIAPIDGNFYSYKVRGVGSGEETGGFSDIVTSSASAAIIRVPGFREEDVAAVFLDVTAFGSVAIWHRDGEDDIPLRCIFDAESTSVDPDTGQVITSIPQMWASTAELSGLARNQQIEFSGLFYRVKSIHPDGTGLTIVELTRDQAL